MYVSNDLIVRWCRTLNQSQLQVIKNISLVRKQLSNNKYQFGNLGIISRIVHKRFSFPTVCYAKWVWYYNFGSFMALASNLYNYTSYWKWSSKRFASFILCCNLTCQFLQSGTCTLLDLSCHVFIVVRYFVWLGSKLPCEVALHVLPIKVSTMVWAKHFLVHSLHWNTFHCWLY